MAQLKMGDTTLISDSSGTPSFQTGLNFPTGHIIQVVRLLQLGFIGLIYQETFFVLILTQAYQGNGQFLMPRA